MRANLLHCVQTLSQVICHQRTLDSLWRTPPAALTRHIVKGTLQHYLLLCKRIDEVVKIKPKDTPIKILLATALYQMHMMGKVSAKALAFEAHRVAGDLKRKSCAPLVYAVLKKLSPPHVLNLQKLPSQYALPSWIYTALEKSILSDRRDAVIQSFAQNKPHTDVRIVRQKTTLPNYTQLLETSNLSYATIPWLPDALRINVQAVSKLPGLSDSLIYIQDPIHQLIPHFLPLMPKGSKVLDACASPGGKAGALLNLQPTVQLTCLDLTTDKTQRIARNLAYASAQLTLKVHDATKPLPETWGTFDAILLDVPCAALGTLRKNPEIQWTQTPDNLKVLVATVEQILNTAWKALKPGGYVLYSTCSLTQEENSGQIAKFLENMPDATCHPLSHPQAMYQDYGLWFLPCLEHGGAFVSLLQKTCG